MPKEDPSGIRDKIFIELKLESLHKDDGIQVLLEYMNSLFFKGWTHWNLWTYIKFDRYQRKNNQQMKVFILEFEKLNNRIIQNNIVNSNMGNPLRMDIQDHTKKLQNKNKTGLSFRIQWVEMEDQ